MLEDVKNSRRPKTGSYFIKGKKCFLKNNSEEVLTKYGVYLVLYQRLFQTMLLPEEVKLRFYKNREKIK